MSDHGHDAVTRAREKAREKAREQAQQQAAAQGRAQGLATGWTVFSYLLAGMAAYGGIGWLIGRALHIPLLFPIGMLVGLGISLAYVVYRFGRQQTVERSPRGGRGDWSPRERKEITGDR